MAESTWLATDKRQTFIETLGTGASTKIWLNKYKVSNPYTDYISVIYCVEVLLHLIEGKVRSTSIVDPQAVALLSAIRTRSDATTMYTIGTFIASTDLTNAVLLERRIKFLRKGLRSNDLTRLLQPFP